MGKRKTEQHKGMIWNRMKFEIGVVYMGRV